MPNADAEHLITHLAGGLHPDDRQAFRQAAEAALATATQCWGPGSLHRTLVPVWRKFFRPTRDNRYTVWDQNRQRRSNNLIDAPAPEDTRAYHSSRIVG